MIYGMFFYRQKVTWWRAIVAVFLVMLISNVILTTLWLDIMGTPWQGIIGLRTIKNLTVFPFQAILTYLTLRQVERLKPQLHLD